MDELRLRFFFTCVKRKTVLEENSKRGITETPFTGCKCHSLIFQTPLSTTSTLRSVQWAGGGGRISKDVHNRKLVFLRPNPAFSPSILFVLRAREREKREGKRGSQVTSARENNMSFQYPTAQPPPYTPVMPMQPIATAPAPNAHLLPDFNVPKMPVPPSAGWSLPSTTYPHGLEYLMALDYLFVVQKVELLEAFTGFETKNKYSVVNVRGEPVFYVAEESSCCARCCLGRSRPCEIEVFDNSRKQILRMVRPFRCDSCCCPCCLQELEVYSGDTLLGSVTQDWSLWQPSFSVRDASGETVLTIRGPWIKCCVNVSFKVRSADGEHKVGEIKKQWTGLGAELFTDADHFGISFPLDLDVKMKAVLLGACLLIDFMYFEGNSTDNNAAECAGLLAALECLR